MANDILANKLTISVSLDKEVRMVHLDLNNTSFDELEQMINYKFNLCGKKFMVKFLDKDGCLITILNTEDLEFALQCSKKLQITVNVSVEDQENRQLSCAAVSNLPRSAFPQQIVSSDGTAQPHWLQRPVPGKVESSLAIKRLGGPYKSLKEHHTAAGLYGENNNLDGEIRSLSLKLLSGRGEITREYNKATGVYVDNSLRGVFDRSLALRRLRFPCEVMKERYKAAGLNGDVESSLDFKRLSSQYEFMKRKFEAEGLLYVENNNLKEHVKRHAYYRLSSPSQIMKERYKAAGLYDCFQKAADHHPFQHGPDVALHQPMHEGISPLELSVSTNCITSADSVLFNKTVQIKFNKSVNPQYNPGRSKQEILNYEN